jgi:cytochrome c biogenesis protein CcmG, thiol:disulfide interchange protein DsbE
LKTDATLPNHGNDEGTVKRVKWLGLLAIVGVLGGAAALLVHRHLGQESQGVIDVSGKAHTLNEFRGQPIILHFWASWCPPCLSEISQWVEFAETQKGKPIRFIAVSLDTSWKDALKILPSEKLPSNVISLLDVKGELPEEMGTFEYPETYLLDSNLKILTKWVGAQPWSSPQIKAMITEAVESKPLPNH